MREAISILLVLAATAASIHVPDHSIVEPDLIKREHILGDCGSHLSKVRLAISNCNKLATIAQHASESGNDGLMDEYFGDHDQATRAFVAETYRRVAFQCASTNGGSTQAMCDPNNQTPYCARVHPYAGTSGNKTILCAAFFRANDYPSGNSKTTTAGIFIHELTHSTEVRHTSDNNGRGKTLNAMNYGWFSRELNTLKPSDSISGDDR